MLKSVPYEPYLVGRVVYKAPPKKHSLKSYYKSISLPWEPTFFYHTTSFASLTTKHVGPCHWIMYALKYVFWGPQPS
jgi:hypothetical protein